VGGCDGAPCRARLFIKSVNKEFRNYRPTVTTVASVRGLFLFIVHRKRVHLRVQFGNSKKHRTEATVNTVERNVWIF
jgi:hypothetical protein